MHSKRIRLFLTLLAVSIALMTLQNHLGIFRPFRFLEYPINFVNNAYVSTTGYFGDTFSKYTVREKELRRLRTELKSARLKLQRLDELKLENQRLKEALGLSETLGRYVATARVISRGSGRWANTYVIDKGTDDLVEKDMAVITPKGLLGKVQEAHGSYSVVLLIDDSRFSVAVRLGNSRVEAVLSGAGLNRCTLKYVDTATEVSPGESIITSGLDGLFPPGIAAAFVTQVETTEGALFHRIEAVPLVDTRKIEEVIIVRR